MCSRKQFKGDNKMKEQSGCYKSNNVSNTFRIIIRQSSFALHYCELVPCFTNIEQFPYLVFCYQLHDYNYLLYRLRVRKEQTLSSD